MKKFLNHNNNNNRKEKYRIGNYRKIYFNRAGMMRRKRRDDEVPEPVRPGALLHPSPSSQL